ncbi:MAG: hypothetical protein GQ557_02535 [Mycoplasmataceae bacterium]|nr:hypothetical protein [Mycoplasmataceae bacterium]
MRKSLKYLLLFSLLSVLLVNCDEEESLKPIEVETGVVISVDYESATVTGEIIEFGKGIEAFGHCWSTNPIPSVSDEKTTVIVEVDGNFQSEITGLIEEEKYYYRSYALNEDEVVYGQIKEFITTVNTLKIGLVAFYPFDGNVNDYSGNENNAANYGAELTTDRFGILNSAYSFDGSNDYMSIDHTEDLNFDSYLNSYTISLWVKGYSENIETSRIIVKWNELIQTPYPFFIGATSTDCLIRIHDIPNSNTGTDCGNIWDESWQHIILVVNVDNGFMDSYINNIIIGSSSISSFVSTANEEDVFIGGTPIVDRYFNGYIDDIRIYNKALTEDEIQALYHEDGWDL